MKREQKMNCQAGPSGSPSKTTISDSSSLSLSQKARIESNRQRALMLKQARSKSQPYSKRNEQKNDNVIRVEGVKFIDTGGGFLLEQKDGEATEPTMRTVEQPPPFIEPERPSCEECSEKFIESFLMTNFDHPVCDKCRDNDGLHSLITKTDARNEYLLKDCDLEKREPPLRFLVRKNPHDARWGDMKLYLQLQVERRALEVWGSEEQLEEERELREHKREKSKEKKYNKKMKELRMAVRSSLYNRTTSLHEHEFGPEKHVEEDTYTRQCNSCGYQETFEKM
ncbi:hypothetical protein B566_EDAN008228 [Ephemera danica]|nr:hypothetical protein B566_EDAN008228 [Ephemera danica]